MGKFGTSHLLSYSLEKTSTWVWQNGDRFPIQNICSPYKTLLYFLKGAPVELQQTKRAQSTLETRDLLSS